MVKMDTLKEMHRVQIQRGQASFALPSLTVAGEPKIANTFTENHSAISFPCDVGITKCGAFQEPAEGAWIFVGAHPLCSQDVQFQKSGLKIRAQRLIRLLNS